MSQVAPSPLPSPARSGPKHTPVPWRFTGESGDDMVVAADGELVLSVCTLRRGRALKSRETVEANGKIAAAAPELAEAGKRMLFALAPHAPLAEKVDAKHALLAALVKAGVLP